MVSRTQASDYFCTNPKCKGHEVSMVGQKEKRCWLCGRRMKEKKPVNVVVKNG